MVSLDELGDETIRVLDNLAHPVVDFLGVHPLVNNESVEFVEHEACFDLGLPRLSDNSGRLRTHTLDAIDQDESTI